MESKDMSGRDAPERPAEQLDSVVSDVYGASLWFSLCEAEVAQVLGWFNLASCTTKSAKRSANEQPEDTNSTSDVLSKILADFAVELPGGWALSPGKDRKHGKMTISEIAGRLAAADRDIAVPKTARVAGVRALLRKLNNEKLVLCASLDAVNDAVGDLDLEECEAYRPTMDRVQARAQNQITQTIMDGWMGTVKIEVMSENPQRLQALGAFTTATPSGSSVSALASAIAAGRAKTESQGHDVGMQACQSGAPSSL